MSGMSDLSKIGRPRLSNADTLDRLRREAEMEMRRVLDESRPRKRPRGPKGEEDTYVPMDRFHYSVAQELEAGAKGFIITCKFRQEKSATREASQLLRRYLPGHLFPPAATLTVDKQSAGDPENLTPSGDPGPPMITMPTTLTGKSMAGPDSIHYLGRAAAAAPAPADSENGDGAQVDACSLMQSERLAQGGQLQQALGVLQAGGGGGGLKLEALQPLEAAAGGQGSGGAAAAATFVDDSSENEEDDGGGGGALGAGVGPAGSADGGLSALGFAKVSCRGVVLIRLSAAAAAEVDPVRIVESMLIDLESGTLQPPMHCQRIIPLDATCLLTPSGLAAAVAEAAAAFKRRRYQTTPRYGDGSGGGGGIVPMEAFSYAISYHSRFTEALPQSAAGVGGTTAAAVATADGGICALDVTSAGNGAEHLDVEQKQAPPPPPPQQQQQMNTEVEVLQDRNRIISLVAGGMVEAFGEAAKVNLKKPQVAVLVEPLPVGGRQFAGLTVLPEHMFVSKGKLVVKALVKNAHP